MKRIAYAGLLVWIVVLVVGVVFIELRQNQGNRRAGEFLANFEVIPVENLGSTKSLRILPLVDYHASDPSLITEVGVSYLVETDDRRILFDVGQNAGFASPSPLESNMKALGVDLAGIDTVFISHNHFDHVGGMKWQRMNTFSVGTEQLPFPNPRTRAIVPTQMTYPGLEPEFALGPMRLGNGLASTGAIPRQLVIGWIEEQSLVVNVEGLGGVLIVGCGHQPVPNLIERYEEAFSEPLYGVVGGLHFPLPDGRISVGPINGQRRLASGESMLRPMTMEDVREHLDLLESRNLGVIAVGGHDSSDEVIELVREKFGDAHRYVRVGEEIVITAPTSAE
jgi:metal-dependent hydrolase (beta-lactamase superfamily II)